MTAVAESSLSQLHASGWQIRGYFDLCWLDCPEWGFLKLWDEPVLGGGFRTRAICLCPYHAEFLQKGSFRGDYTGAMLPPSSMALEWPWDAYYAEDAKQEAA